MTIGRSQCVGEMGEMGEHPGLARLVVIRHDDQRRRGSGVLRVPHVGERAAVSFEPQPAITGARPAAAATQAETTFVLGDRQRRRLAGRAARHQRARPLAICQSTKASNAAKSTAPAAVNGVTSAGIEP